MSEVLPLGAAAPVVVVVAFTFGAFGVVLLAGAVSLNSDVASSSMRLLLFDALLLWALRT
jgi:hypothetical protein